MKFQILKWEGNHSNRKKSHNPKKKQTTSLEVRRMLKRHSRRVHRDRKRLARRKQMATSLSSLRMLANTRSIIRAKKLNLMWRAASQWNLLQMTSKFLRLLCCLEGNILNLQPKHWNPQYIRHPRTRKFQMLISTEESHLNRKEALCQL